jgi:hypothetical protein
LGTEEEDDEPIVGCFATKLRLDDGTFTSEGAHAAGSPPKVSGRSHGLGTD